MTHTLNTVYTLMLFCYSSFVTLFYCEKYQSVSYERVDTSSRFAIHGEMILYIDLTKSATATLRQGPVTSCLL